MRISNLIKISCLVLLCSCITAPEHFSDGGAQYLGRKYVLDPLGEERAPDTDPLIRDNAFDCTTFVETVLSGGDVNKLNRIRYKNGDIDFLNRNHFIEVDWIPNNSDIVYNVSNQFGKTAIRRVTIDKKSWFQRVHNIDTNFTPQTTTLEYLPYDNIGVIDNNRMLVVLFIVGKCKKCDKIGTDIAVVHMGLLLPNGVLRHASSAHGRVMDTDFYQYAQQRKNMDNNIGIMLLGIK